MNIQRSNIKDIVELNMIQKGMLFNFLKKEDQNLYNVQIVIEIKGQFDGFIFLEALKEVQRKNDVLKSIFFWEKTSEPLQIILKETELELIYLDFSDRKKSVMDYIASDRNQKIDLKNQVPLRISLIKSSEKTFVLIITHHHILYDGWSTGIFLEELFITYKELKGSLNRKNDKNFKISYTEILKKIKENQNHIEADSYWLEYLKNYEIKFLPRTCFKENSKQVEQQILNLPMKNLSLFAQNEKVTKASIIYVAYGLLLQNYLNTNDVVFATPISNRNPFVKGSEQVMGNFITTLPLRVWGIEGESIRNVVKKINKELQIRNEYSGSSYFEIKKTIQLESNNDLFDTVLAVENYPLDFKTINSNKEFSLKLKSFNEHIESPILIQVFFREKLEIVFQYDTNFFDDGFITAFSIHFKNILFQIISEPDKLTYEINCLTKGERHVLLSDFNSTNVDYGSGETVLDLIGGHVAARSTETALSFEGNGVTYGELWKRSDALARYLMVEGVSVGSLVPICLDRSTEMVVGILGILKAGCAYVPIDPEYPSRRISYILEDIGAGLVLTQGKYLEELAVHAGLRSVALDSEVPYAVRSKKKLPGARPKDLIYVIYTSGTTGNPKGVMNEHGGVFNRLSWMRDYLGVSPDDTILQKTTFCFDVSAWEIFLPLVTGCRMILAAPGGHKDSGYLQGLIEEEKVTMMHFVPSMLSAFLSHMGPVSCASLRHVICSGEELKAGQVRDFRSKLSQVKLHNLYGPTEAAIDVTAIDLSDHTGDIVPIGRPVANTRIYIMDRYDRTLPIGVPGELCIGGVQVARGYLNRPELTSEKFVASPFVAGDRLYRTGDLARWSADGTIEFIGRRDDQVKVRGYRIELGEIESALESLPSVSQAIVLARGDMGEGRQLVGYIVSKGGTFDQASVIGSLQELLPDYMVPRVYVELGALPLTVNGKVDRKALPRPDLSELAVKSYVAPSTATERELVSIWEGVLGVSPIGVTGNFFELGGDSIKAIQLMGRSNMAGFHFKVKDVFMHQTILELSRNLEGPRKVISESGVLEGGLGLLPIQSKFFALGRAERDHYNQSVLLEIPDTVSVTHLSKAVGRLALHHDTLRLRYELSGGQVVQSYGSSVPTLIGERATKKRGIASICQEYQASLDLEKGEVCRFVHITTGGGNNRLFIVAHHLSIDGVSWRILLEDLESILQGLQKGREVELPAKGTSYRQWGDRLSGYARKISGPSEVGYWEDILSHCEQYPADRSSDVVSTYGDTARYSHAIEAGTTQSLLQDVNRAYGTEINDVLLAALGVALTEGSGRDRFVVALEGHGREELFEDVDISRTVGWFTSMYPVLLRRYDDIGEQLAETKDMLRDVPDKGMGYGLLRHMCGDGAVRRSLSKEYGSVVFNYLGSFDNSVTGEGLWRYAGDTRGMDISLLNTNENNISIDGMVIEGELRTTWSYDALRYDPSTIEGLAAGYERALRAIVVHCRGRQREKTRSDYGLPARMDNRSLASFRAEMSKGTSPIVDIYGLSPLQEGMLFHNLYEDGSMSYVSRFSCDFSKGLDVDLFRRSWEHLMAHHSVLRTGIHAHHFDIPVQCVYETLPLPITEVDYTHLEGKVLEHVLQEYTSWELQRELNIRRAPLFGLSLVHLPAKRTRLLLKYHHILWDGWSLSILMGQFVDCYRRLLGGGDLPELRSSDYGRFVRELGSRDRRVAESFWRGYLKGLEGGVFLPFVKGRQERNQVFGNATQSLDLGKDLVKGLVSYAQRHRLTINTLIQGAWCYLLSRYTGSSTVAFGATVSGRDLGASDIENEVGLYINTLPVCADVPSAEGLSGWLSSLQEGHTRGREEHGHVSLGDVQGWMDIQGSMFDSLLVFENYPVNEALLGSTGLEVENVGIWESTNYVLTLGIKHTGEELSIMFEYSDTLLEPEVVRMIKGHMRNVLASMALGVGTLGDIRYMDDREREELLYKFNDTGRAFKTDRTIIDLFEEQAARTPSNIAIVFNDSKLTYEDLNILSNQLANYLIHNKDIKIEDLIGVNLKRGTWLIISILAILKTGAAYVPIAPDSPVHRSAYIKKDSGYKLLINDDFLKEFGNEDVSFKAPKINLATNTLAYVIYTSGSTGNPKGVMVEHRSLVTLVKAQEAYFKIDASENILQFSPFYFDASIEQLWLALVSGASLVLINEKTIKNPGLFRDYIIDHKVTHLHATPSFLDTLSLGNKTCLRRVISGGEECRIRTVEKFINDYDFYNEYGPTETTVTSIECKVTKKMLSTGTISIGRPMTGTAAYIFDKHLELSPIGVIGELYIGGTQVARGYLNNVPLTSERFVPNPFDPADRLYRTGDLAKWLPDGTVFFLGRNDRQRKVRGYRIELSEIETTLERLTMIDQAVVVVKEDSEGANQLIAYLVCSDVFDEEIVKKELMERLPIYMIPNHYVEVEAFILTRNGKIDYGALPKLEIPIAEGYKAPSTEIEKKLVAIWSDLLGLDKEKIGVTDSFFRLGGHSLKMIILLNLIRKEFNVKVKLEPFYKNPQIRELGKIILVSNLSANSINKESVAKLTI